MLSGTESVKAEVQWAVRWVGEDLWGEGFVEQVSFKIIYCQNRKKKQFNRKHIKTRLSERVHSNGVTCVLFHSFGLFLILGQHIITKINTLK